MRSLFLESVCLAGFPTLLSSASTTHARCLPSKYYAEITSTRVRYGVES